MIHKWRFLRRKSLLEHSRIHIVEDTVELPDGKRVEYVREAPTEAHSVAVIAVNDAGDVLLQKEYSYPPDEVMYQLPGGGINPGEEIITAANRELSEESGLSGKDCKLIGYFYMNNRRSNRKQYVVECRNLQELKAQKDAEEFIENEWLSLDQIHRLIKDGKITNSNLLAALQLYEV